MFAYELRMQDEADDRFTKQLLEYIDDDNMNPLLKDIVFANKKNSDGSDLEWSNRDRYKLLCGKEFKFVMKYAFDEPYAILQEDTLEQ